MVTLKETQEAGSLFFLTIKSINGLPILASEKYYKTILDSLDYCRKNKGWKIYAYTILINHLHLVLKIMEGNSLSGTVKEFKSFTAHEILKLLKEDKRYNVLDELRMAAYKTEDRDYKIWRKSCWPETISSEKFLRQKIKYTDLNAMKHGVVEDIENYPYTSYHNHYCEHEFILKIDDMGESF